MGLATLIRRRLFRLFLLLGLSNFLFNFAVIYLLTEARLQLARQGMELPPFVHSFLFTETGSSYADFIFGQSTVVMLMLAYAGTSLVGDDFRHRSLSFYLSKPIGKIHYFLGKFLAAFALAAALTLLPALALFVEYGAFTDSLAYWRSHARVFFAIVASGTLVSVASSVLILGVASWCRRTVPILIVWGGLFVFLPLVARMLRTRFQAEWGYERAWYFGLLDFWTNLRWISNVFYGIRPERYGERLGWSLGVLALWMLLALFLFWRRIQATEVVR
jgi:ABC-type transport system involved in multi-copper enzyme maturation permease subunit